MRSPQSMFYTDRLEKKTGDDHIEESTEYNEESTEYNEVSTEYNEVSTKQSLNRI